MIREKTKEASRAYGDPPCKQATDTPKTVINTPQHDPLLTITVKFQGVNKSSIEIQALIDSGASAPVM